jgi:hypothetical protein
MIASAHGRADVNAPAGAGDDGHIGRRADVASGYGARFARRMRECAADPKGQCARDQATKDKLLHEIHSR